MKMSKEAGGDQDLKDIEQFVQLNQVLATTTGQPSPAPTPSLRTSRAPSPSRFEMMTESENSGVSSSVEPLPNYLQGVFSDGTLALESRLQAEYIHGGVGEALDLAEEIGDPALISGAMTGNAAKRTMLVERWRRARLDARKGHSVVAAGMKHLPKGELDAMGVGKVPLRRCLERCYEVYRDVMEARVCEFLRVHAPALPKTGLKALSKRFEMMNKEDENTVGGEDSITVETLPRLPEGVFPEGVFPEGVLEFDARLQTEYIDGGVGEALNLAEEMGEVVLIGGALTESAQKRTRLVERWRRKVFGARKGHWAIAGGLEHIEGDELRAMMGGKTPLLQCLERCYEAAHEVSAAKSKAKAALRTKMEGVLLEMGGEDSPRIPMQPQHFVVSTDGEWSLFRKTALAKNWAKMKKKQGHMAMVFPLGSAQKLFPDNL